MKNEREIMNCRESFENQEQIQKTPETKKMLKVLCIFCDLILGKRNTMIYPGFNMKDIDEDKLHEIVQSSRGKTK